MSGSVQPRPAYKPLSAQEKTALSQDRNKFALQAQQVISSFFHAGSQGKKLLEGKSELRVLVPGAGFFTSFVPFSKAVAQSTTAKKVTFTLLDLESAKKNLELFSHEFFAQESSELATEINAAVDIVYSDLKSYLKNSHKKFDLVYFEHPDISAVSQLIDYFRSGENILNAFPYLANILHDKSLIVSAFQTPEESWQMARALGHCYGYDPKFVSKFSVFCVNTVLPLPVLYACGSVVNLKDAKFISTPLPQMEKLESDIAYGLTALRRAMLISFSLYAIQMSNGDSLSESTLSILSIYLHVMLHKPGAKGIFIKAAVILLQLLLLVEVTHNNANQFRE